MNIIFNKKDDFITKINNLLSDCLIDQVDKKNLKFDIVEDFNKLDAEGQKETDYFKELLSNNSVAFSLLILKRVDLNDIVSMIFTYIQVLNNDIFYALHSKTFEQYGGRKYNQILRAAFVLSAKYITINGNKINYIGSEAVSPISDYIWSDIFGFKPVVEPKIFLTTTKISELSDGTRLHQLKYPKNEEHEQGRKTFIENIKKLNIEFDNDELNRLLLSDPDMFFKKFSSSIKFNKNLKRFEDWTFYVKPDEETGLTYIVQNDETIHEKAKKVLMNLFSSKIGNCKNLDKIKHMGGKRYKLVKNE